jgi:sugar/nucleoside kinase (ribokinase family)
MTAPTDPTPLRTPDDEADSSLVDVVVVGAATRDIASDDPRGWRLGGPVTYAALAFGRLGLGVTALVGVDETAATASEFDLLRAAGVDLRLVRSKHGAIFENVETPAGRRQRADELPEPLPTTLVADAPRARGWYIAPVAGEIADSWAEAVPASTPMALGWQGLLRTFGPDGTVVSQPPAARPLVHRADLISVSGEDIPRATQIPTLLAMLGPAATLVITRGGHGGILVGPERDGVRSLRSYPAIAAEQVVDTTGAGDTFLAGLFAARLRPGLVGNRAGASDVLLGAAVGSLAVEQIGLDGVPHRDAVRARLTRALTERMERRARG